MGLWAWSDKLDAQMQDLERDFLTYFNFSRPKSPKEVTILSYAVKERLNEFAREVLDFTLAEKKFFESAEPRTLEEISRARQELAGLLAGVEIHTKNFRQVRNLAWFFGFGVRVKTSHYWAVPKSEPSEPEHHGGVTMS